MSGSIPSGNAPFDLSHLCPIKFDCPCAGLEHPLRIRAVFSPHCYTDAYDPQKHIVDAICVYDAYPNRPRVFSVLRYALSLQLPEIVRSFPGVKVHQTAQARNYVYAAPVETADGVYCVFFMLQRNRTDGADLRLTVESAYPVVGAMARRKRPNTIRFSVLALKIFKRQPVRFSPR